MQTLMDMHTDGYTQENGKRICSMSLFCEGLVDASVAAPGWGCLEPFAFLVEIAGHGIRGLCSKLIPTEPQLSHFSVQKPIWRNVIF